MGRDEWLGIRGMLEKKIRNQEETSHPLRGNRMDRYTRLGQGE